MQVPSTPPRSSAPRYPTHLSRCKDKPQRTLLHHRGTSHMYESLEDLLTEAGYKETRIFTPEAPQRHTTETASTNNKGTVVGNAVVKLLSTWMSRESTELPHTNSALHPKHFLRHTISAPHMHKSPRQAHTPPSPSWLTSLFTPRTPPSTPTRRRPGPPRILSHPRVTSSHVAVTRTNVVCRPAAVRASSASSSSTRSTGKSRRSSRGRGTTAVPTLLCQSHQKEHDCDDQDTPPPSTDQDDSDYSDDEGELDLTRILIPAKRQHSIRSLRAVLLQNPQRPGTPPARRISSLNPSRDRPHLSNENRDPSRTPRRQNSYRHHQASLPVRITREPLHEEPANLVDESELEGGVGEEGHWDSGEFMSARVKRLRSGLPRAWAAWGQ